MLKRVCHTLSWIFKWWKCNFGLIFIAPINHSIYKPDWVTYEQKRREGTEHAVCPPRHTLHNLLTAQPTAYSWACYISWIKSKRLFVVDGIEGGNGKGKIRDELFTRDQEWWSGKECLQGNQFRNPNIVFFSKQLNHFKAFLKLTNWFFFSNGKLVGVKVVSTHALIQKATSVWIQLMTFPVLLTFCPYWITL